MKLRDIYHKFCIPPNLAEHMIRVYGVTAFIHGHWSGGETVDWDMVSRISLIHDLGNIVKFNFNKHPEFLGPEQKNVDYWRRVQQDIIARYGTDDHTATTRMLEEIPVSQAAIRFISDKQFINARGVASGSSWELKILYYGDFRVLPDGIGSLADRLADLQVRYSAIPDISSLIEASITIENQIKANINVPVSDITGQSAAVVYESVLDSEI